MPTTLSIFRPAFASRKMSMVLLNSDASERSVVMSLKRMPGLGKSGTSRNASRSFWIGSFAMAQEVIYAMWRTQGRIVDGVSTHDPRSAIHHPLPVFTRAVANPAVAHYFSRPLWIERCWLHPHFVF